MRKEARGLWQAVLVVATYYIWKSRNTRVFKGKIESRSRIFQDIQIKTFEWVSRRAKKHHFPWQRWIERPADCGFSYTVTTG